MEQNKDLQVMLDRMEYPAFLAQDGLICAVNTAARQRSAEPGASVQDYIVTGQKEFEELTDGSLYTTICLGGILYQCVITRLQKYMLFSLDDRPASKELQALSLAATQLRRPISDLSVELNCLRENDSELFARMNQTLHRIQRIIGNMSDAADYADAQPKKHTQEIVGLFRETLEKAKALLSYTGAEIRTHLPAEPVFTLADDQMLTRAVYNLLSNACKFSSGPAVIDISLKVVQNKIYLTVYDNGAGVDSAQRSTMFTRYKREPGIEDPRFGIGLGMSLIHSAATAHGGTVLVEHPEERGTRITMSLSIEKQKNNDVRSPILEPNLYGGHDSALTELSDILPYILYK